MLYYVSILCYIISYDSSRIPERSEATRTEVLNANTICDIVVVCTCLLLVICLVAFYVEHEYFICKPTFQVNNLGNARH